MKFLHDPAIRSHVETRLKKLQPQQRPAWGKMSVDQMLWHVNQAIAVSLGQAQVAPNRAPLPRPLMKFAVLNLPWIKNAPTNPAFVPTREHDFSAELSRCLRLIADFTAQPLGGAVHDHPLFGAMSVTDQSRLHAKHLDHHLKQFGC